VQAQGTKENYHCERGGIRARGFRVGEGMALQAWNRAVRAVAERDRVDRRSAEGRRRLLRREARAETAQQRQGRSERTAHYYHSELKVQVGSAIRDEVATESVVDASAAGSATGSERRTSVARTVTSVGYANVQVAQHCTEAQGKLQ
jgi:hypothetical protein